MQEAQSIRVLDALSFHFSQGNRDIRESFLHRAQYSHNRMLFFGCRSRRCRRRGLDRASCVLGERFEVRQNTVAESVFHATLSGVVEDYNELGDILVRQQGVLRKFRM